MDDNETARWLGESGDLVSRYAAAVGEHTGRMASVNADLRAKLARERRRVAALRGALVEIKKLTDVAGEATIVRTVADLAWRIGRIAERHIPVAMEEADSSGQGGEGATDGAH